ncbi:hypothetical protein ACFLZZ_02470 [Nanoarchaeota archaeon]
MKKGELIILILLILAVVWAFDNSFVTGEVVVDTDTRESLIQYISQGSELAPKTQCNPKNLRSGTITIGSEIRPAIDCRGVDSYCIEKKDGELNYVEIFIGERGGTCKYLKGGVQNYFEGTRIHYDVLGRKITVISPSSKERLEKSRFLEKLNPLKYLEKIYQKCEEEVEIKVEPTRIKKNSTIIISAIFKCRRSNVPVKAKIFRNGDLFEEISLYPEKEGIYSNTFYSKVRGKYSIEVIG